MNYAVSAANVYLVTVTATAEIAIAAMFVVPAVPVVSAMLVVLVASTTAVGALTEDAVQMKDHVAACSRLCVTAHVVNQSQFTVAVAV